MTITTGTSADAGLHPGRPVLPLDPEVPRTAHSNVKAAVRDRVIAYNPRDGTSLPNVATSRRDIINPEQFDALLNDTRGMGMANAWAAVQADITQLDASIGGLGGCPRAGGQRQHRHR